jgi:peroxiredoxin
MRIGIKLAFITGVLLIVSGSLVACSNPGSAINTPAPSAAALSSSDFKISNLAVNPAEVNAGVQALITARVTNTGNKSNQYQGHVRIDDPSNSSLPSFLPSDKVNIGAGETQIVSAAATMNNPGLYTVSWDGVTQTLKVDPGAPEAVSSQIATGIAPDFTATDIVTGKTISLAQFKGSVVLLNFVNYGCSPALNQIVGDQLLKIRDLTQQRTDFTPISVFCGCCSPTVLRQFAKENGLNWPWILDTDYSIAKKYSSDLTRYGYPTLIFIDKDQTVSEVAGYTDLPGLGEKIDNAAKSVAIK